MCIALMDARQLACFILAAAICMSLITMNSEAGAAALEDQLPDTTGLFFGKRAAHPNMNNLLFGRRSLTPRQLLDRPLTEDVCRAVHISCSKLQRDDDEQQQD